MDDTPLVFAHGITGGRMLDARGRLRWIGARQALGLDRAPLAAPLTWGESQDTDDLVPDGPLDSVLGVPVYGKFLAWAQKRSKDFRCLAYDWRRDLFESKARLQTLLEAVMQEHGRAPRVVAHSMGGLVTWLLLRERPELASGVLFAGVPFGAGISFGGNMHGGIKIGLNSKVGNAEAHCSWTAPYAFFPSGDPQVAGVSDHDWYDAAAWQQNRLGPFSLDVDPAPWRGHLERALVVARRTRDLLDVEHPEPDKLPPIALLSGTGHGAVQVAVQGGASSVRGWDFHSGESIDGDGAVGVPHTVPPGRPQSLEATTPNSHQKVLDDVDVVGSLFDGLGSLGG
jgi:pimeloyl-ACP methyl ester carboxylesterase